MESKVVGIVGGMGPEAGVDLVRKIIQLTPATKDQDHIHVILDNYTSIPDRTAFILGRGENPLPYLLKSVNRLKRVGAEIFAMACNTAHYFYDDIVEMTGVYMLHIAKESLGELKTLNIKGRVGLMGTMGVVVGKVYEGFDYDIVYPDQKHLDMLMEAIYGIKAGIYEKPARLIDQVISHLVKKGVCAIIMACTEIPLVKDYLHCPVPLIDSTLALAKGIVRDALKNA